MTSVIDIDTPHGTARAHLEHAGDPVAGLVLGHGAGGGVGSPDLVATAGVAAELGLSVALVEQPYRVAGRRSPAPARQLDAAWLAVCEHLRGDVLAGLPLFAGGRSSGARVACRTADAVSAAGVICLAFPLLPPRAAPEKTRLPELEAPGAPVLVVQGARDPFGMPQPGPGREVVEVAGTHTLRGKGAVAEAVRAWLADRLAG